MCFVEKDKNLKHNRQKYTIQGQLGGKCYGNVLVFNGLFSWTDYFT